MTSETKAPPSAQVLVHKMTILLLTYLRNGGSLAEAKQSLQQTLKALSHD